MWRSKPQHAMQITAITHRRKPVFASIISQVTPSESSLVKKVPTSRCTCRICATRCRSARPPRGDARGAHQLRPVIFVQYAAGTPRSEVWRGMHGAASLNAIAAR